MKPEALSVAPTTSVREAIELMEKYKIHHLLVMDGKDFKGLIEGRDLIFTTIEGKSVADVMKTKVPMIYESTDVGGVLEEMFNHKITALPIVEEGQIVGILTETDLLKLLKSMLGKDTGLPILIKEGEAALSNPLIQNVFRLLSDIGL